MRATVRSTMSTALPRLRRRAAVSMTSAIPDLSMIPMDAREGPQRAETRKEKEAGRRRGSVTRIGNGTETGSKIEIARGIAMAIIETTRTEVKGGSVIEINLMIMIVTMVESMIGTGIMKEIEIETKIEMGIVVIAHGLIGHDLGLDQRVDPVEDQGLVLVQDQRANESVVLTWPHPLLLFFLVQLPQAMLGH